VPCIRRTGNDRLASAYARFGAVTNFCGVRVWPSLRGVSEDLPPAQVKFISLLFFTELISTGELKTLLQKRARMIGTVLGAFVFRVGDLKTPAPLTQAASAGSPAADNRAADN
jgi:hypothetical protein